MHYGVDIKENEILALDPSLLDILLIDRSLSMKTGRVENIFWATNDYQHLGKGFQYKDQIQINSITENNEGVIMPRILKEKQLQQARVRDKAEVFTPSWICNTQNNIADFKWFGRENVFNTEIIQNGVHSWITNENKILFPKGKTWKSYVKSTRLEVACGEAPYIASRYDTTTGDYISVRQRVGLLDRKLRVIAENTDSPDDWKKWARIAFQNTYGFEWQGDNLILAREALLSTYIESFVDKFLIKPELEDLLPIAEIVSWNIWQMDGLKGVIPDSCHEEDISDTIFEDNDQSSKQKCIGCRKNILRAHNGVYCYIMDWEKGVPIQFISLINR